MAEFFDPLTDQHIAFVERQPVFFVATAAADARINLSPKGMDCFRVLSPTRVAYLDVAGSGNETNAHLIADGRITIMFCAFDNPALIFRLYGRGAPGAAAGRRLGRARRALHPAARHAADLRHRGRSGPDQLRLGRAAHDASTASARR